MSATVDNLSFNDTEEQTRTSGVEETYSSRRKDTLHGTYLELGDLTPPKAAGLPSCDYNRATIANDNTQTHRTGEASRRNSVNPEIANETLETVGGHSSSLRRSPSTSPRSRSQEIPGSDSSIAGGGTAERCEATGHLMQQPKTVDPRPGETELTRGQIQKLKLVLWDKYSVHGPPDQRWPAVQLEPVTLIRQVKQLLEDDKHIDLKHVSITGGAASFILGRHMRVKKFNDLDVIFAVDFPLEDQNARFNDIRDYVMGCLKDMLPPSVNKACMNTSVLSGVYVQKMFKKLYQPAEGERDCWNLISLRNYEGNNVEFKFVRRMKREYEFSTDSFQIILNDAVLYLAPDDHESADTPPQTGDGGIMHGQQHLIAELTPRALSSDSLSRSQSSIGSSVNTDVPEIPEVRNRGYSDSTININEEVSISGRSSANSVSTRDDPNPAASGGDLPYPRVFARSMFGDIKVALEHLNKKQIMMHKPQDVRGGGLLKYADLLYRGYQNLPQMTMDSILTQESYMLNRFLIDFEDVQKQYKALRNYMQSHYTRRRVDVVQYLKYLHAILNRTILTPSDPATALAIQNLRKIKMLQKNELAKLVRGFIRQNQAPPQARNAQARPQNQQNTFAQHPPTPSQAHTTYYGQPQPVNMSQHMHPTVSTHSVPFQAPQFITTPQHGTLPVVQPEMVYQSTQQYSMSQQPQQRPERYSLSYHQQVPHNNNNGGSYLYQSSQTHYGSQGESGRHWN